MGDLFSILPIDCHGRILKVGKVPTPALLQGTLDLLILHALQRGPMHGYAIAQTIHLLSDEVLKVEEGSLYPALHRLELDGAISAKWGLSENNRKAKYYKITAKGRKAIAAQQETWARLSAAVHRVLAR
jgi:transcriptional regulator